MSSPSSWTTAITRRRSHTSQWTLFFLTRCFPFPLEPERARMSLLLHACALCVRRRWARTARKLHSGREHAQNAECVVLCRSFFALPQQQSCAYLCDVAAASCAAYEPISGACCNPPHTPDALRSRHAELFAASLWIVPPHCSGQTTRSRTGRTSTGSRTAPRRSMTTPGATT